MAEKQSITAAFYMQLITISTIVVSSVVGFSWGVEKMKDIAEEKIKPLVERIDELEKTVELQEQLIADNSNTSDAVYVSVNLFLESYNRTFHKEFLRPLDITSESIKPLPKKRKK